MRGMSDLSRTLSTILFDIFYISFIIGRIIHSRLGGYHHGWFFVTGSRYGFFRSGCAKINPGSADARRTGGRQGITDSAL